MLVLLFAAKRLPELGGSLGGGLRDFRKSLEDRDVHAQVAGVVDANVVDANASTRPTASALQTAPPPVAHPSVVQSVTIAPAADEPRLLPPAA